MVSEGRGRLFKRKDGKYLVYLPKDVAEDSMFPFKDYDKGPRGGTTSAYVKVSFSNGANPKLIIEPWTEPES